MNDTSASIGIIGGADGPTAIIVASPQDLAFDLAVTAILIAAIVLLIRYFRKKKKK